MVNAFRLRQTGGWAEVDKETHREVFAVQFEVLPHAEEQVQVEMIQQQVDGHIPLPAGLQKITEQLYVTEGVHHYGQGLLTHISFKISITITKTCADRHCVTALRATHFIIPHMYRHA